MKIHSQILRRPSAQQHAVHKNFKILSDFSVPCVNLQLQLDGGMALIDLQIRRGDRVIHPVMNIKLAGIILLNTALILTSDLSARIRAAAIWLTGTPFPSS